MGGQALILERRGAVAIVAIDDAPYNRMSLAFMDALEERVGELAADDGVRAVVLTAAGDTNFSVGMNLKELPQAIRERGSADAVFDQRLRVLSAIETMGKPWIATLYGYCLGGGEPEVAGERKLEAAADGAQIGLPEMHLGTVPAWGGSARLVRCVGRNHALDMILRAKTISGPRALEIGLVNEVWPNAELKDRALALADELASMPRLAVRGMLECLVGSESKTLDESLRDDRRAVLATFGTPDQAEGMRAFAEKRKPVFNR